MQLPVVFLVWSVSMPQLYPQSRRPGLLSFYCWWNNEIRLHETNLTKIELILQM
jgi:hypothetical protein